MVRINNHQLFCLIVLHEIGSSTLFALGIEAKQDAWIVVIIGMLFQFVLLWIYTELQKYFPDKNFVEIVIKLLGKLIGIPIVLLYVLFFLYASTRNVRDFGELISLTILPKTPMLITHMVLIITAVYVLFLGLEVVGRTSEVLLPVVLFFILSVFILVSISRQVNLNELKPFFEEGYKPVIKAVYPQIVNFPFGEMFVFSMYWSYTNSNLNIRKISYYALIVSGILLTLSMIIIISVLGVELASKSTIPMLEVIKLINISNIITNLDAIGTIIMFVGGFYKVIIFFYAGVLAITTLLKIENKRWIIVITGIFILWLSITFESSYTYHLWLGQKVSLSYIHNSYQVVIPPLLLIICWLKMKSNRLVH